MVPPIGMYRTIKCLRMTIERPQSSRAGTSVSGTLRCRPYHPKFTWLPVVTILVFHFLNDRKRTQKID